MYVCMVYILDDNNDPESQKVLEELENIDDECDALKITFVKIDNAEEASEYGIESMPALLYFEKGNYSKIPSVRYNCKPKKTKKKQQQSKINEKLSFDLLCRHPNCVRR